MVKKCKEYDNFLMCIECDEFFILLHQKCFSMIDYCIDYEHNTGNCI